MWNNPFVSYPFSGNYHISLNPADGLPEAFTQHGQLFTRRPANPHVSHPPSKPQGDSASESTTPAPSNAPNIPSVRNASPLQHGNLDPRRYMDPIPPHVFHSQPQAPQPVPPGHNPSHDQSPGLKSALKNRQYYSQPHPSMWPTIPPGHETYAIPMPSMPTNFGASLHNQSSLPVPLTGQTVLPAEASKYKCVICGRFRSARYHYKHPLLPGQLPGKTICRKCRQNATDSEDASTDSYEARRSSRRRSHSRSRSSSKHRRRRSAARPRPSDPRSQSRGRSRRRETEETDLMYSSSSSADGYYSGSRYHRSRPNTPVVEVVRYVERAPAQPVPRRTRTVFVNEPAKRTYVEDYYDEDEDEDCKKGQRRSMLRSSKPTPHESRGYNSDPMSRQVKQRGELRNDCNDRTPSNSRDRPYDPQSYYIRGRKFESSKSHDGHDAFYESNDHTSFKDDQEHIPHSTSFDRTGRCRKSGRGRYDGGTSEDVVRGGVWVTKIPSPPLHRLIESSSRQRDSESLDKNRYDGNLVCGENEVIVIESDSSEPPVDYDWYDSEGMKVRVREI